MAYGLLETGFEPKTFEVIQEEITADLQTALGLSVVTGALAKVRDIFAEREASLWELGETIYHAFDPDGATGDSLDIICEISGTLRNVATHSTVTLTLTGTAATVVSSGSRVATTSTAAQFETIADATLVAASAWANGGTYVIGDIVKNASRIYICITSGTAGAIGPTTTSSDFTDGSVHWRFVGAGTALITAAAQAVNTGPTVAAAFDIVTIVTPVGGWSGVMNLLDADEGTDIETHAALRIRRAAEVDAAGASVPEAIKQRILEVADVTFCQVFYNDSDLEDANGIPPHAVQVLVRGGTTQDIVDTLFVSCIAAGIGTYGTVTGTSTDSEGVAQTISFSRPTEEEIYIDLEIDYIADRVATDYQDQIKLAIVTAGDLYVTGEDVVASAISAVVHSIRGIKKVRVCNIDVNPGPGTDTDIVISLLQLAVFDTSRITISDADAVSL